MLFSNKFLNGTTNVMYKIKGSFSRVTKNLKFNSVSALKFNSVSALAKRNYARAETELNFR